MQTISITEAKKNYDEMIERAEEDETFIITGYGRETAVVLPVNELRTSIW